MRVLGGSKDEEFHVVFPGVFQMLISYPSGENDRKLSVCSGVVEERQTLGCQFGSPLHIHAFKGVGLPELCHQVNGGKRTWY